MDPPSCTSSPKFEGIVRMRVFDCGAVSGGERPFASPISRSISRLEFFWVSGLSHLPFANAQKVHQTDSNPGHIISRRTFSPLD